MRTRAIKLSTLETPQVFWGLVLAVVLFAGLYAYLINATVLNVAARQNVEKNITRLSSETGKLEASYMSMKNSIDLNLAHSLGFNSAPNTKYINRTTLGQLSSRSVE